MKVFHLLSCITLIATVPELVEPIIKSVSSTSLTSPLISSWLVKGSNWNVNTQSKIITAYRIRNQLSTLETGFWSTENANRVALKVTTKTYGPCLLNITDNTNCQFTMSYSRALMQSSASIFLNSSNFPENTFFNESNIEGLGANRKSIAQTNIIYIDNMTDFAGINFRFSTLSYTGLITEIDLSYLECPEISENLVNFKKTAAPDIYTNVTKISGKCEENAVESDTDTPSMECWYDGRFEIHGLCVCEKGYTKDVTQCEGRLTLLNCPKC